jgi:hypothetical protein
MLPLLWSATIQSNRTERSIEIVDGGLALSFPSVHHLKATFCNVVFVL